MRKFIFIFFFSLICSMSRANTFNQDTIIKAPTKIFDKAIMLGTDFQGRLLVGLTTPQMLFHPSKNFHLGPAFFPIFWWNYKTGEMDTKMGVGARFDYKRHTIAFNTFKVGKVWDGALMVGIKF